MASMFTIADGTTVNNSFSIRGSANTEVYQCNGCMMGRSCDKQSEAESPLEPLAFSHVDSEISRWVAT